MRLFFLTIKHEQIGLISLAWAPYTVLSQRMW